MQLIQNKSAFIDKAMNGQFTKKELESLFTIATLFIAAFGFAIGLRHSWMQALATAVKLPLLFILTGIICFPTLFILQAFIGVQLSFKQLGSFLVVCIAISGTILLSFTPIIIFFLISGTPYQAYKIINVIVLGFAGFSGFYIFKKHLGLKLLALNDASILVRGKLIINLWILLYGCIGANLGFILSPVFGDEHVPFIWFTSSSENFFTHLIHLML
jgi:hypothetical protein